MRSHDPSIQWTSPGDLGEQPNPLLDFAVAVLGLVILALCWAAVWVLVTRPVAGESASFGTSVVQVLESSLAQFVHRTVGPLP